MELGQDMTHGLVVAAHQAVCIIGDGGRDGLAALVSLSVSDRDVESRFPYALGAGTQTGPRRGGIGVREAHGTKRVTLLAELGLFRIYIPEIRRIVRRDPYLLQSSERSAPCHRARP